MCYSGIALPQGQAAAAAAAVQQNYAGPDVCFDDEDDAFGWLDALDEEDPLGMPPVANTSADESAQSSQIKMEGELRNASERPQGCGAPVSRPAEGCHR
jgi:hypothetical protein